MPVVWELDKRSCQGTMDNCSFSKRKETVYCYKLDVLPWFQKLRKAGGTCEFK